MPMHIIHELWGEKLVCKLQLVGREMKARLRNESEAVPRARDDNEEMIL